MTTPPDDSEILPRWDLDTVFPGPDSPEFLAAVDAVTRSIEALVALFDQHGVGARPPAPVDAATIAAFDDVVNRYDTVLEDALRLDSYLMCLTAADAQDEVARTTQSAWYEIKTRLARLAPRFTAWVGELDVDALSAGSPVARAHEPALRRLQTLAAHLMPHGEEELAALLAPSGGAAWVALHDELMAMATARIERDGAECELPLSEIDNLRLHPDRDVRRRAHEVGDTTRQALATPLAAALNGMKGQQLVLSRRRGWDDPLAEALFANAIDRPILETMLAAMREALPDYRRYLRAKARLLGLPRLAGYDLMAPVATPAPWPFAAARAFIVTELTAFSPRMGALAERAFAERWIDAGPRLGKEGGAFCTSIQGDESRILANYLPVFTWMSVLAHELGHAYHNFAIVEQRRTCIQASPEFGPLGFPLTLAETASTICEAIVQRAARSAASPAEEAAQLEEWLQTLTLNVFGIMPMFAFEQEVFATRARRELTPVELEALMAAAWHNVAGDTIDPDTVWSMTWTMGHFFIDSDWYYNVPYAFGMLFALGLLAARDTDPNGFLTRFDTLLADSGMREANELAAAFGIDLHDPAFWNASLDTFRADVDRYETLTETLAPASAPTPAAAATAAS
ncbi:MAG: oligoendopeptidase F [Chloroflexia bacterium]|nr:oligoendopeptidase F [Chloroflexia bacterium]